MARAAPYELAADLAAALAATHTDLASATATHHLEALRHMHQIPAGRHALILVGGADETPGSFPTYDLTVFLYHYDPKRTLDRDAVAVRYADILHYPPELTSAVYVQKTIHTHLDPELEERGLLLAAAAYTFHVER